MSSRPGTRIQTRNRHVILDAGLDEFSRLGFAGATLDAIATGAGLSKPNLLYYFDSKDEIYRALLGRVMATWLEPMREIDPGGDPVEEILAYVKRKLAMSEEHPRESRLFATEILSGAPRFLDQIEGDLRDLVDQKVQVIEDWQSQGRLAKLDGTHLIFSIWATTQHYADFHAQVVGILDSEGRHHFEVAENFLEEFYRRALTPR